MDISWETFSNSEKNINQFESQYLSPSTHSARIGGKVLLFGNNSNKSFNGALRLSLGRKVFSDNWNGYFFSELMNSYRLNDNLSFQLNPKLANANEIRTKWLDRVQNIGITAGASSPEILIKETLEFLKDYYEGVNITTMQGVEEKTVFKPLLNFS